MSGFWKTSVATIAIAVGLTAGAYAQDATAPATSPAPSASPAPVEATPATARPVVAAPETAATAPTPAAETAAESVAPVTDTRAIAAVVTTPKPEGCFVPPAKLLASEVDAFLGNPSSIYDSYGRTSVGLSNRIRGLAGSDPRTLQPILGLIPAANTDQRAAIGAGLGRAAFACARLDAVYAQDIQTRIAELNTPEVVTAFLTASNDVQVAALGAGATGGAGAAAPGLSGGGDAGPFSAGLGGDEVVAQTVQTYSFQGSRLLAVDENGGGNSTATTSNNPGDADPSPADPN